MKLLSYFLSIPFAICTYGTLLLFHVPQWIAIKLKLPKMHRHLLNAMCWCLCRCQLWLGNRIKYTFAEGATKNWGSRPVIVVANHQSMFDIPPLGWLFRRQNINYISKKELANGVPSLSINLKYADSTPIDRKEPQESEQRIREMAKRMAVQKSAVLIFPEGTRSRDGVPKKFKPKGLSYLLDEMPEAVVVPVTVNNSWKVFRYGAFPFGLFNALRFHVHESMELSDYKSFDNLFDVLEAKIKSKID